MQGSFLHFLCARAYKEIEIIQVKTVRKHWKIVFQPCAYQNVNSLAEPIHPLLLQPTGQDTKQFFPKWPTLAQFPALYFKYGAACLVSCGFEFICSFLPSPLHFRCCRGILGYLIQRHPHSDANFCPPTYFGK